MNSHGKNIRAWHRWTLDLDVDHFAKAVLHTLRFYVNDDGECWPAVVRIARESGMSVRKARSVIKELTDGGHLEVIPSPGRRTNVYRLPPNPAQCAGLSDSNPARNTGLEASQPGTTGISTRHERSFNPARCASTKDRPVYELEDPPKGETPGAESATTPARKAAVVDIGSGVL